MGSDGCGVVAGRRAFGSGYGVELCGGGGWLSFSLLLRLRRRDALHARGIMAVVVEWSWLMKCDSSVHQGARVKVPSISIEKQKDRGKIGRVRGKCRCCGVVAPTEAETRAASGADRRAGAAPILGVFDAFDERTDDIARREGTIPATLSYILRENASPDTSHRESRIGCRQVLRSGRPYPNVQIASA